MAQAARQRRQLLRMASGALAGVGLCAVAGPLGAATGDPWPRGRRVALLFGNAQYPEASLRNPVRDARLLATTLKDLGFEVLLAENASRDGMYTLVRQWLIASADAQVRAFYYAGHGVQYRG